MKRYSRLVVFVVGLSLAVAVSGPALAGRPPVAVSPGSLSGTLIGDACPTFSWGTAENAGSYELVVYRLSDGSGEARPVLRQTVDGSASGWTPSLDRCLERGARYAWSVRSLGSDKASEWSVPSLFDVASGPGPEELEAALEVVRTYLAGGHELEATGGVGPSTSTAASPGAPAEAMPRLPPATTQLSVDGNVDATSFTGDGENLTGVATDTELADHTADASAHHAVPTTLPPSGAAGGDLAGTFPNPTVVDGIARDTEVTAAVTAHKGLPNDHHAPPTTLPPSGAAGGDLAGTFPNPTVVDAIARDTEVTAAVTAHKGLPNDHHAPPTTLPPSGAAGGDLSGTYPNPTIAAGSVTVADLAFDPATQAELDAAAPTGAVWVTNGAGACTTTGVPGTVLDCTSPNCPPGKVPVSRWIDVSGVTSACLSVVKDGPTGMGGLTAGGTWTVLLAEASACTAMEEIHVEPICIDT